MAVKTSEVWLFIEDLRVVYIKEFGMKKSNLLWCVVMALVLALAQCGMGDADAEGADDVEKTIEVTGITAADIKKTAQVDVFSVGLSNRVYAATGSAVIADQTLSVDLYDWPSESGQSESRWTGSGKWYVCLRLFDAAGGGYADYLLNGGQTCAIQEAVTTLDFGDVEPDVGDGSSLTVLFHADGGRPATQTRTVPSSGGSVDALPTEPVKAGSTFGGWYSSTDGDGMEFTESTIVTADLTVVYAKWSQTVDNEASRDIKVSWGGSADSAVKSIYFSEFTEVIAFIGDENAPSNDFTVTLYADKATAPVILPSTHITLTSGTPKTLSLSGNGSLFTVGSGVMLTLSGSIVLQGHAGNNTSLVRIETGGTFAMSGGTISGNESDLNASGVFNKGTFTMSGGTISGNTATSHWGGGVYNYAGNFTMLGGTISGNKTIGYGGGVYNNGTFTMSGGGTISENTAAIHGGGVYNLETFMMSGGTIRENIADYDGGGGVYNRGTFMMSGGIIWGNESQYGGGVFTCIVPTNVGTTQFSKEGGIIYGSTTEAGANANTTTNEGGAAIDVYEYEYEPNRNNFKYKRSATAGVDDNLTGIDAGTGFWDGE
jgi:hypothetical protein